MNPTDGLDNIPLDGILLAPLRRRLAPFLFSKAPPMPKEPVWERHAVVCPKDLGEPKELLTFIQLDAYTEAFIKLELTDDEQRSIEIGIMMNPTLPPVIEGTGGVREFQCSTPTQSNGSLHLSVFYVYFPESEAVALALVAHTDDCGIMTNEERAQIKLLIEEIQQDMGW